MPTQIAVPISSDEDAGKSMTFEVSEEFDEVLNKVAPLTEPSSQLEYRECCLYHDQETGTLIFLPPRAVAWFRELDGET